MKLYRLALVLTISTFLTACGRSSSDDSPTLSESKTLSGTFNNVEGVRYETTSGLTGFTDGSGSYEYLDGDNVTFLIGDAQLGSVETKPEIDVFDFQNSDLVSQVLFSLDRDSDFTNGYDIVYGQTRAAQAYPAASKPAGTRDIAANDVGINRLNLDEIDGLDPKYRAFLEENAVMQYDSDAVNVLVLRDILKVIEQKREEVGDTNSSTVNSIIGTNNLNIISNDEIKARAIESRNSGEFSYRIKMAVANDLVLPQRLKIANKGYDVLNDNAAWKKEMALRTQGPLLVTDTLFELTDPNNALNEKILKSGLGSGQFITNMVTDEEDAAAVKLISDGVADIALLTGTALNGKDITTDVLNASIDAYTNTFQLVIDKTISEQHPYWSLWLKGGADIVNDLTMAIGSCGPPKSVASEECIRTVTEIVTEDVFSIVGNLMLAHDLWQGRTDVNSMNFALELWMGKYYLDYQPTDSDTARLEYYDICTAYGGEYEQCAGRTLKSFDDSSNGGDSYFGYKTGWVENLLKVMGDFDPYLQGSFDTKEVINQLMHLDSLSINMEKDYSNQYANLKVKSGLDYISDEAASTLVNKTTKLDVEANSLGFNDSGNAEFRVCLTIEPTRYNLQVTDFGLQFEDTNGLSYGSYVNRIENNFVSGKIAPVNNISSYCKVFEFTGDLSSVDRLPLLISKASVKYKVYSSGQGLPTEYNKEAISVYTFDINSQKPSSVTVKPQYDVDNKEMTLTAVVNDTRPFELIRDYQYYWNAYCGESNSSLFNRDLSLQTFSVSCQQKVEYALAVYDGDTEVASISDVVNPPDVIVDTADLSISMQSLFSVQSGEEFNVNPVVYGGTPPYSFSYSPADNKTKFDLFQFENNSESEEIFLIELTVTDSKGESSTKQFEVKVAPVKAVPSANYWDRANWGPYKQLRTQPAYSLAVGESVTQKWGIFNGSNYTLNNVTLVWDGSRSSSALTHSKSNILIGNMLPGATKTISLDIQRNEEANRDFGRFNVFHEVDGKLFPLYFPASVSSNQVNFYYEFTTPIELGTVTGISPSASENDKPTIFTIRGENFPTTANFSIQDCIEPRVTWKSSSQATLMCTPITSGSKYLYAAMEPQGEPMTGSAYFSVSITEPEPEPIPSTPTLSSPSNGSELTDTTPTLSWNSVSGATYYQLVLGTTDGDVIYNLVDINGTSKTTTTLTAGKEYRWTVRACNDSGCSDASAYRSFTVESESEPIPSTPTLSSPSNGSELTDTTPTLSWNSVSGATYYQLVLGTTDGDVIYNLVDINGTSKTTTTLTAGKEYRWTVRACNDSGCSDASAYRSFTVESESEPIPSTPTLSSPSNGSELTDTTPTLSWNSVSGATYYQLVLGTTDGDVIYNLVDINGTSKTTTTLTAGKEYRWTVRACNDSGCSDASAYRSFTVESESEPIPSTPTLSSPSNGSELTDTTPTLSWNSVSGATYYQLVLGTTDGDVIYNLVDINGTSKTTTTLTAGKEYRWTVRACNDSGCSDASAYRSFTIEN